MRKHAMGFLALVLAAPAAGQPPARVEQMLTLPESLQRALQNNHHLLSAGEDIRIAENRVREAKAQFYPQLGLNFNASRYLAEQHYLLPEDFGSTILRPSQSLEPDNFYSARAWMRQSLYSGGRTRNNLLLARANLERARIEYEEIRSQVTFDTIKAFYDLLLSRKQIQLAREAAAQVQTWIQQPSARDAGAQARLRALQGRFRRQQAEKHRTEQEAYVHFLRTLGLELFTTVDLEGELETSIVPLDLAKILVWARESRLELRRTDYQKQIDRLAVNLSQAERFPVVAAGVGYEFNDRRFPLQTLQWNATLNVSLPIFDGFSSRARIRQRRLQANQSRIQRAEVEDGIYGEVRNTHADLVYWQAEIQVRGQEAEDARAASLRAQKDPDVADRAAALEWAVEAGDAYWTAVHGHRVAIAKLERAVGRPLRDQE